VADDSAQRRKHGLVLLERSRDFLGRHPRVGIESIGLRSEFLSPRRIGNRFGDSGEHFRVARTQPRNRF
jgi:hypothetical protein